MRRDKSKSFSAFYVITTSDRSKRNIFKIGIHSGSVNSLISRYTTYFPELSIYYFQYIDDALIIENKIKYHFFENRIININGNRSEWINIKYKILYDYIKTIIPDNYNIIIDIETGKNIVSQLIKKKIGQNRSKNVDDTRHLVSKYNITVDDLIDINEFEYDFDYLCNESNLDKNQYTAYIKYKLLQENSIVDYKNNSLFRKQLANIFEKHYGSSFLANTPEINKKTKSKNSYSFNIYNDHQFITIVDKHNTVWFKAKDVASEIEYKRTRNAIATHVNEEDTITWKNLQKDICKNHNDIPYIHPMTVFINKGGLYDLILKCKLESSKKFKHWITHTVLPTAESV